MLNIAFLFELNQPNIWRPRVELYIMKDNNILVGKHPEIGLHVPGGGIEPGQDITKASITEALEEAGVKIKNVRLATKENYYEDWYKLVAKGMSVTKKDRQRMKQYRGIKHYYVRADFDGFNNKLLGSQGDALKNIRFVSKKELINAYQKQGKVFDPPQYQFRIKVVRGL
jgi:ADP-ribose pyrophosphatase YjhB (NUDIX family)